MKEFDTEQAFEMLLSKLQEAYQGRPAAINLAVEVALSDQRADFDKSLCQVRQERQNARTERDAAEVKAKAGEKLFAAITKAHGEFIDDPTACLMNIKKALDEVAEHLDPDFIPF